MTQVIRLDNFSENYKHDNIKDLYIGYYVKEQMESLGADLIVYYYYTGGYEGSGEMICLKAGQWYHFDISHNSCHGPLDDVYFDGKCAYNSLVEMLEVFSEEAKSTMYMLISAAEATLAN
jgi:hypothetical protein